MPTLRRCAPASRGKASALRQAGPSGCQGACHFRVKSQALCRLSQARSLIVSDDFFRHSLCWSTVRSLFAEWQQRVQSRFELERLSERDLADMKLTRLEIFDETRKPFWQE